MITKLSCARLLGSWVVVASIACAPAMSPGVVAPADPKRSEPTPAASTSVVPRATASVPAAVASAPAVAPKATITRPAGCPEELDPSQAQEAFQIARSMIERAGEHPGPHDLEEILPRLRAAAYAGLAEAQVRYGSYVVGYWATDGMFWPHDRKTAVSALAMLRIAALRDPKNSTDWYGGLAKDPVDRRSPPLSDIPTPWLNLALEEARAWKRCHPDSG